MTTPNLEIEELADGAKNYLLANEAFKILERASCGRITVDFTSDADLTLDTDTVAGTEQWRDKFIDITDSGTALTAGRDVIFPAENGPMYTITNSTAQTLTLKISGQSGVTLATTVTGNFYYNGTDIIAGP